MNNQPQQRFCTNCGQPLAPGAAFCAACGVQMSAPTGAAQGQFPPGTQSGYASPYIQAPAQAQEDVLLAGLAASTVASQGRRNSLRRGRRPGSKLFGCGCLLLALVILAGPFIGVALTSGKLHLIFAYVAGGVVLLFCLFALIGVLATRRGREALSEGCLEAILSGFLGGG